MKKLTMIAAIAGAGLLLGSCKKEKDPNIIHLPDGTALHAMHAANVSGKTQHFTVNAGSGGTIMGTQGTTVTIYGNSLYNSSNQLVTGNVTVDLVEIYNRADMVLLNKPTMGKLPNGDMSTLVSGGEYYLKITQNGQELHTNGGGVWVTLPGDNTGGIQAGMLKFNGFEEDGLFGWNLAADSIIEVIQDSAGTAYGILDGNWGWTNVDRFYSDPRPKTVLKAKLPEGYDNTNCEVFLTYDGEATALASLDTYTADGFFSEHYGLIPIGLEVHFIAVTMIDGELNYAIQGATITDGHIEYITSFTPITQAALAILINDLP